MITVTYYLEVLSSWCHWAEPTWRLLHDRFADQVTFDWQIALMRPADFPVSREQCDWFYRRSGPHVGSDYMLNSGWFDPAYAGDYAVPNLVAGGARELGCVGDCVRLALAHAALREGQRVNDWAIALPIAAKAGNLSVETLTSVAKSAAVRAKVDASTAAFFRHQINQRPAFVITSEIGDKAVFSGLYRAEPLIATIESMLADVAHYRSHTAHFGVAPLV